MPERENKKARSACIVSEKFDEFIALTKYCEDPKNVPSDTIDELFAYLEEKFVEINRCHAGLLELDDVISHTAQTFEETESVEFETVLHCVLHIEIYFTVHSNQSATKAVELIKYITSSEYPLKSSVKFKNHCIDTLGQQQSNTIQKEHQNIYSMTFAERQKFLANAALPLAKLCQEVQDRIRVARIARTPYTTDLSELLATFTQNFTLARKLEKNDLNANYAVLTDNNDYIFDLIVSQLKASNHACQKVPDLLGDAATIEDRSDDSSSAYAFFSIKLLKTYQVEKLLDPIIDLITLRAAIAYEKWNIKACRPKLTRKYKNFSDLAKLHTDQILQTMSDLLTAMENDTELMPSNREILTQNTQILEFREELAKALRRYKDLYKTNIDLKINNLYRSLVQDWLTFSGQAMRLSAQQGMGQLQDEEASHEYLYSVIQHFTAIHKACACVASEHREDLVKLRNCMAAILLNMLQHLQRKYYIRITNPDSLLQILQTMVKVRSQLHNRELKLYLQMEQELKTAYLQLLVNKGDLATLAMWYDDTVTNYDNQVRGAEFSETEDVSHRKKIEPFQVQAQKGRDKNSFMHHYASVLQAAETLVPRREIAAQIAQIRLRSLTS